MSETKGELSFWEHLDELRGCLIRVAVATAIFAVVAFLFKAPLFDIVLAPQSEQFFTYRIFDMIGQRAGFAPADSFHIELINTGLAEQFLIHVKLSFYVGFLCVLPYTLFEVFRFLSPALYQDERRYARCAIIFGYAMFMLGVAIAYLVVFPLTFRFLGTYQVDAVIANLITLQSYTDTLTTLILSMGILFELPLLCWVLGKCGLIDKATMIRYRRHAIVAILIAAAVITPTSDIFTMALVALPIYLLYEASIWIVGRCNQEKK